MLLLDGVEMIFFSGIFFLTSLNLERAGYKVLALAFSHIFVVDWGLGVRVGGRKRLLSCEIALWYAVASVKGQQKNESEREHEHLSRESQTLLRNPNKREDESPTRRRRQWRSIG